MSYTRAMIDAWCALAARDASSDDRDLLVEKLDEWGRAVARRPDLTAALDAARATAREQGEQLAGLLALLEAHPALAWLHRHAQHPPTCGVLRGERCTCGLNELMGKGE